MSLNVKQFDYLTKLLIKVILIFSALIGILVLVDWIKWNPYLYIMSLASLGIVWALVLWYHMMMKNDDDQP